jgi:membrane-associated phospholipid phosphatase
VRTPHLPAGLSAGKAQARRPVVWLCLGLVAWAAVFGMITTAQGLAEQDRPVLYWLVGHRRPALTQVLTFVSSPTVAVLVPAAVIVTTLTIGIIRRTWRPLATVVLAFGGASVVSWTVKTLVRRTRPSTAAMLGTPASGWSFPSGHTLLTSALLGAVVLIAWRTTASLLLRAVVATTATSAALVMGLSRMYLGDHWLTDVLASYALAVSVLAATAAVVGARRWTCSRPDPSGSPVS